MSPLQVRHMTSSDIGPVTNVHFEAFQGYLNTSMGRHYVRRFFEWFVNYPDAIRLVAVKDNDVAGYVVGAPIGYQAKLNRDLMLTVGFAIATHPWVVFRSGCLRMIRAKLAAVISRIPPKTSDESGLGISLIGIGVSTRARGASVASNLMRAFENEAVRRNADWLKLSVYSSNTAARQLYEKNGWKITSESDATLYYFKPLR